MLTLGALQRSIAVGAWDENVKAVEAMLSCCRERGLELLVLPEMWPCGFDYEHLLEHARRAPSLRDRMCRWAREFRLVIVGSIPELRDEHVVNCAYVVDPRDGIVGSYAKVHLFSPLGERDHFRAGESVCVCHTCVGLLGVVICYDLRFPELCRLTALNGATILCVPALWPKARVEHWRLLLRARAVENQMFVIGANGVGMSGNVLYPGASAIVDPWGDVLAEGGEETTLLIAQIQLSLVDRVRRMIPCFADRHKMIDTLCMESEGQPS